MELVSLILTFLGAYGIFMFLAYGLARIFFPTIETEDGMKENPRRVRPRDAKRFTSRVKVKNLIT